MNAAVPGTGQGCSVTVLGSSCSIPRPGRACSAYLIAGAGTRAVVDFGSGALANLRLYCEPDQLDAVVISHMHADHFFDLIPLRYALKYGARSNGRKIAVHLPPGGEAILRRVGEAFARESPGDFFDEVFRIHTYDPFAPLALSEATFRFAATTHYIPTFAVRYDLDDISVTYSADTAFDPAVATLASQTSLFLCEATVLPNGDDEALAGHLRPGDAGRLAHLADVRHLCVTHYPSEIGESELRVEASREFGGEISLADDHYRWSCAPASAGAR